MHISIQSSVIQAAFRCAMSVAGVPQRVRGAVTHAVGSGGNLASMSSLFWQD